jgi:hypothetical protein
MIKAEELMIGNYVEYVGEICQVISVSNSYCTIGTRFPRGSIVPRNILLEYINPILITEEILLKLGIKYNTWNTRTRTKFIPGFFLKDSSGITYFKYGMRHKDIIVIKSVHQLQNLCFNVTQKHLTFNQND